MPNQRALGLRTPQEVCYARCVLRHLPLLLLSISTCKNENKDSPIHRNVVATVRAAEVRQAQRLEQDLTRALASHATLANTLTAAWLRAHPINMPASFSGGENWPRARELVRQVYGSPTHVDKQPASETIFWAAMDERACVYYRVHVVGSRLAGHFDQAKTVVAGATGKTSWEDCVRATGQSPEALETTAPGEIKSVSLSNLFGGFPQNAKTYSGRRIVTDGIYSGARNSSEKTLLFVRSDTGQHIVTCEAQAGEAEGLAVGAPLTINGVVHYKSTERGTLTDLKLADCHLGKP